MMIGADYLNSGGGDFTLLDATHVSISTSGTFVSTGISSEGVKMVIMAHTYTNFWGYIVVSVNGNAVTIVEAQDSNSDPETNFPFTIAIENGEIKIKQILTSSVREYIVAAFG